MRFKFALTLKEVLLIITLLLLTIMVNWPVISFNLMYSEQATIFNANQTIHSLADLIRVYTHPQMLDFMVPFFRPSGHFLMYQLLTPFLGWYNTKALIIVNMLFLGLVGYMIIKLYAAFFPGFKGGGYIAFSIYLMNPALMISKVTIMHFEFAYVFFVLWSLYCLVMFCKKNLASSALPSKFQHTPLLLAAIVLYIIAVTFKEPALMLGPVLACYFLIAIYQPGQVTQTIKNKDVLTILILLTAVSAGLALYLTMSWQQGKNPLLSLVTTHRIITAALQFTVYLFSLTQNYFSPDPNNELIRLAKTPMFTHYIMWTSLFITTISLFNVFRQNNTLAKKSLLFLLVAMVVFMLLPLWWSMGFGWHLSLSFVCEALIIGFGLEFYARHFLNKQLINPACITVAMLIGLTAYPVDQINLDHLARTRSGFVSRLNQNAVFHPPQLAEKLTDESILVVQDQQNFGDYLLGNSTYPAITYAQGKNPNFDFLFTIDQQKLFWRVKPLYSGTLFHWAYFKPGLKEEVVAFTNENMNLVPDDILLNWVRHINNILCVSFDNTATWFDNTAAFKKNIVLEQNRRHLLIKQYKVMPVTALHSDAVLYKKLLYADPELCETVCDNTHHCKGFTYTQITKGGKTLAQCFFYNKIAATKKPCQVCTGFIKLS